MIFILLGRIYFWRTLLLLRISTVINIACRRLNKTQSFLINETRMFCTGFIYWFIYWFYTVLFLAMVFSCESFKNYFFNIKTQSVISPFALYFKSMNAFRIPTCDFHIFSACFFWIELMNYIYVGSLLFIILTVI